LGGAAKQIVQFTCSMVDFFHFGLSRLFLKRAVSGGYRLESERTTKRGIGEEVIKHFFLSSLLSAFLVFGWEKLRKENEWFEMKWDMNMRMYMYTHVHIHIQEKEVRVKAAHSLWDEGTL
jgi:hypothetical protein